MPNKNRVRGNKSMNICERKAYLGLHIIFSKGCRQKLTPRMERAANFMHINKFSDLGMSGK